MSIKKIVCILFILMLILVPVMSQDDYVEEEESGLYLPDIPRNTARVIGILSFAMLGLTVFIGGASRLVLDKKFGLPSVLNFHKKFALVSLILVMFHPVLLVIAYIMEESTVLDFFNSYVDNPNYYGGVIALIVFWAVVVTSLLYKKMNHAGWQIVHIMTFFAFFFSGYHMFELAVFSGQYGAYPAFNVFIFLGDAGFLAGLIIRIITLFKHKRYRVKVRDVIQQTHDTWSIAVDKPAGFMYKAGQFAFISFGLAGMKKPHPFTISSSPGESMITFTIKSIGSFTSNIRNIKPGTDMILNGPYGTFTLRKPNAVFIAGGVGITPFYSMLKEAVKDSPGEKPMLFYGNKTESDIIFNSWLQEQMDSGTMSVHHVLSKQDVDGYHTGFIDESFLKKYGDFNKDYYLCGPPGMIKHIKSYLRSCGVKRIYYEKFFW